MKEILKRTSSPYVVLIILLLMGIVPFTNSHGQPVEPGYSQYPIALGSVSAMSDNTIHTTSFWSGRVTLDGNKLGNPIPAGSYAVITVDSTYLESFTVPAATIVTGSRLDKAAGPNIWNMYVNLDRMDSATTASFLYNLKFKNRVTPEGYQVTPQVDLYIPAGTPALTDDIHIGTSLEDPAMQPTVTIKTNEPVLNKHIISNASNTTFALDNRVVYGGLANADSTAIESPADVAFQYTMSTTQGYQTVNGEFQGWGDGKNRTRAQSQIVITDTLPTYTKMDGSTGTASFDPAKNPGWTDNGDGTVSYTVNETAPGRGDADNQLMNTVKLLLQFPEAKLDPYRAGLTNFTATSLITNTAKAELHPVNESDYEKENKVAPTDSINFRIDNNPTKQYDGVGTQFFKNTNMAGRISVDPGSMDQYDATFSLSVTNINPEPMTNIVITDGPFDSRHYLKKLYGGSSLLAQNIQTIYGVKADGTKVPIDGLVNATRTGFNSNTIIDQSVYDQIAGYVAQVKAGTLSEEDVPPVPATYTSIEIELKPEFALQPGQSFGFLVGLGYTDPYHLTVAEPSNLAENIAKNTLRNEAKMTGEINGYDFLGTGASSNRLYAIKESFGMTKSTGNNLTGTPGEELRYSISFQNNLAKARQFNNARIVDVLPEGVTFKSTYPVVPSDKITLVDNFMGSGKQAVIIDLGTVLASDMPSKNISIYATINDNATPSSFAGANEDNMNYTYLMADNWKDIPAGVAVNTLLPDIHNLNGDGTTESIIGSKSTFTALMPTDVTGVKYVRAGTSGEWSLQPVYVNYDSPYQYKLTIRNNEGEPLNEATIYDILPFNGDTYYNYEGDGYPSRNSAFSGLMTGPVEAPEGFTVMYRTDSYMPPNPDAGINDSQAWKTEDKITDWNLVKGFKISTDPGTVIGPYSTTDFIVNMKTRTYVLENNLNNVTSNNSFAIRYNERDFGQSNLVSVYLTQAFPVKKVWDGGPEQKEEVYVQLVRDGIDMPDRILPLNEANDWEASFGDLPVYSPFGKQYVYTVREVNTPINYTSNVVGNQTEGFTLTNTYVSPELEITGRKIWDGGPNTDDYQVALQLYRWIGDGDYTNGPDGELDPKDEFDSNGLIAKEAVGNVHYVNKDNNWTSSKNNPINNKDGVPYNYVVREVKTPFTRWDRPENYDQIVNESTDADGNLYYGEKKYDTDGNVIGWAFDVTNKYKSPIGDILTSKVWVGGDYSYPKILIDLYRYKEGQDPSEAEKIVDGVSSATTNISPYHIYKDMPLSDETDGVPYVYRIEEVDLSALTPEEMISRNISQADVDQFSNYLSLRNFSDDPLGANDPNLSIINEYISPRLMVEGRKTWVGGDAENRPEVTLQLLQNGEAYIPKQTLTGTGVPGSLIQVNSGTPAVHTTKVHPDGNWYLEYNEDISQEATLKIVQTETGKDGSDTVIWQGGASTTEASTGENPSAVPTVTSFKTPPGTITVAEGETAQWNVPRTDFFEQNYNYQVIEVEVPENYTDTYSTPVEELDEKGNLVKLTQEVINTYTPDTIEVTANKEWQGGPETKPGFELQLYRLTGTDEATKTAVGQPVALLTETSHTWNVPEKDADGNLYTYFVEESTPPENYTASYKVLEGSEDKLTIVNTFTPEPIKIPVQKVWMGGALEDRPETLTVGLYIGETLAKDANGEDLLLTLNSQGQWQGEFANVPTIGEDLNPIEYNVKETIPEGFKYTPVYEGDQNRGFRITNNFVIEKTDITAEKKWVGGENIVGGITRPPVQVQLLRNLVPVGDPVWVDGNTDTNELEPWKYTWKEMPRQDMTGTDYIYTIQEVNVPENFVADHDGLTVTNTYTPAQRDFTATKVWEGGPADHPAAVFQLYRTLTTVEEKEAVGDLIYVRDDVHTWRNLPVTNSEGQTYSYWVEETNIPDNYTSSSGEVVNYSQTITNTYEILKGTITGYKSWVGGPAEKPDITLILERQIGTGPKEVVAEQNLLNGNIDAVWENIEQTDINGNPYIFSVREKETPANYTVTYNGMTAINTYAIPKDGVVQATKIWEGGPDTNRPDVYFALYRQVGTGTPERVPNTDNVTVSTLDGETSATVSWSNIETKDANGNDYIFTVKEVGTPSRYTKIENGLNVTNTYKVDSTSFTATKKWVGGPAEKPVIGLQLKQRLEMQTETQAINFGTSVALTDATTHEWTDLPKTDVNGIPYIYSVDETSVPRGYQKTLSQVTYTLFGKGRQTITNTMEAKDISFEKTWVGGPAAKPSVTIGLRVNGEQITDINGKVVSDMVLRNGVTEGSFQNLPYYDAAGEEIQYSLVELEIGGIPVENGKAGNYNVAIQGNKITNTYIPEKTTINVEKVWEGGSEESHQPVEVQLFRQAPGQNKEFVGDPVSLTGAGNWKYQWTDLDETTLNAMEYQYTVEEINPPQGYTAGIIGDGSTENPFVLTNTYNPDKADITAFKKWIGGPIEKPAVDLTLYRKTEAMEEAEIVPAGLPLIGLQNPITIENGDLSYTWKNLPVTDGEGNAYTYSVVEANPPEGYSVSYDGMMVTNTFASENTTITAEKVWTGGPEADHIAPEFVLYQNGKELTEAPTISPDTGTADRFTYTWEVPKTDEFGQDYQYSVDERTTPEGYGKSIVVNEDTGTTTITNTFEAKATDISVHKDWVGGSDYPDITFELQRRIGTGEFERVAEEVLPTGDHIHIWKGQPLTNEQNQAYEYRVIETKIGSAEVVDNKALTYTVTYGGSVEEGFTITNTSDNALEIPVTKVWVDNDDAGQTRPAQITFTAVREDGQRKSQVFDVTEENTYTITGLEKYKLNSTEEYTYTIEETDIGSYEALIEGTTVTNTLKATKDLSFTKTWVGGPEVKPEITVELRANGKPAIDNDGNPVGPLTLTNGQEEGSFTNLPVYTDEGEEIDYAVIETTIDGVTVENNQAGNYTVQIEGTEITNTYVPEKKTVEVEKEWKGGDETNRPPVEVQLFRQAPGQNKEFVGEPVILTGEEGWKYQWTDLDETTLKGLEYEYTVEEINPPQGYTPDLSGAGTEDNPFILTNTYNPDKADITAFKKWIGGPVEKPAVELTLYRKTEAMEEAEIVPAGLPLIGLQNPITIENGDLSYTWKNLPVTDGEGNAYTYSVVEANPPEGYSATYDGMIVTNTFASENTTITAEKVWTGGPEADHIAPEFVLYQNGKELTEPPTISPDTETADRFTYTWEVPKTDAFGQDYQYSVDERTTPEGYGKFIAINEDTGTTTITNTFEAKATDISVHKDWVGGSDYPDITFELQRRIGTGEFERVAEEVLPTGDHIHIWKGQPLTNEQNQAYEYRVIETKIGSTEVVDNKALTYTVTYGGSVMEGFTVTNTSDNALEIPVTKVWVDNDNEGKTRPAQITFTALREDGDRKSQVFDITEENTYTITGLEKYKPNSTEEYTYTIEETAIGNYEALIEGTTVTNTLKATKDLSFTKTWVGGPEVKPEITVELRANGEEAVDNEGNPVETVTLTNGQEEGSFTNLPTYDNQGAFIDYTVVETSIDGRPVENGKAGNYTVLVDGTRIINVFEEEPVVEEQTVDITGQKLWIGGETEKPSIHLQLLQNGNKLGQPVELKEGSTEYTWKDLPMKDDQDTPYKYTVDEVRVPEGYERIPFEGTLVINKAVEEEPITEETTQVTGTKVWINAPDEKPIIELQLKQNGENFLEPVKLTNGNLQAVWSDLPLKDGNGKLYNYTVDEVSIPEGYRKEIIGGNVIVNTKIQVPPAEETISFTGTKIWLEAPNAKPEVQLILLQNGTQLGDPVTLKNGESSVTWNDLPAKDDEGNAYIYKVDEVHVPADYDKILYPNIPSTVFNKYKKPVDNPPAESITVTGKKVWVGGPAAKPDVQLVLLRDGVKQGDPVTLKNGTENYSWTNLLKSDPNGKAYVYSVDEVNVPSGYEKVQNGTTVINIYKTAVEPEIPARTIDVTGTKVWIGGPEKKPAIKLQLKQDGKNFGDPVTLDGKTEYKWTNLPKTNANGKDYVYSVDEVEVPSGYTKTAAGRIVVNTHKDYVEDNLIDITGTKIWKGGPEKKPAIKLQLKQNGKNFGKAVSLDGKTDYKWTDLPKANDSGKEYVYTVDEVEVPEDYTKKVSGMTVTNTHKDYVEENLIDITGSKIWKGGPSNRPVIELQLLQNGKKYGDPVKLDSKTDHTWTGLPKKDEEGKDYKYTIDEVNVPEDYVKSIDGLTVTNTHETFKEDNESGNGAGGTRTNTPARGTNSTGGYSTSRNINPNNNSNRYYSGQRTGEIPKTNDPTVFWGIMSVSMAVLLGAAYTGSKKMNKDEEEK